MAELLFKDEVYAIIGATMEVYNQLGAGFSEAIYQDAMEIELTSRKIQNVPQQDVFVFYRATGLPVGLLINFGREKDLEWKRMVLTPAKPAQTPRNLTPHKPLRINDPKPIDPNS